MGDQSTFSANGATTQESWWAGLNFQRFLLYAAIPAMIITFAVVVTLSKIRQAKPVPEVIVPSVASQPAPDETKQAALSQPIPPQAPLAQPETPKVAAKRNPDKVTDKISEKTKAKNEKTKIATTDTTKKGDESPAAGESHVTLAISPWGEVFVDGKRQGVSPPLRDLKLSAGKHTILIVNETFKPYSQTIELAPNSTHKIKYKFQN